jgi:hypothetical protein
MIRKGRGEKFMTRANKSLGDLESEKFDEDGFVKTTEQAPFNHLKYNERQLIILNEILEELRIQSKYLKNLFAEDPY